MGDELGHEERQLPQREERRVDAAETVVEEDRLAVRRHIELRAVGALHEVDVDVLGEDLVEHALLEQRVLVHQLRAKPLDVCLAEQRLRRHLELGLEAAHRKQKRSRVDKKNSRTRERGWERAGRSHWASTHQLDMLSCVERGPWPRGVLQIGVPSDPLDQAVPRIRYGMGRLAERPPQPKADA